MSTARVACIRLRVRNPVRGKNILRPVGTKVPLGALNASIYFPDSQRPRLAKHFANPARSRYRDLSWRDPTVPAELMGNARMKDR